MTGSRCILMAPAIVLSALALSTDLLEAQSPSNSEGISARDRFSGPVVAQRNDQARAATADMVRVRTEPPVVQYQEMSLRPGIRVGGSTRVAAQKATLAAALPLRKIGGFLIYELRAGKLTTLINGNRKERQLGEFWIVGPADDVTLETGDDSVVLQTIQLPEQ